MTNEYTLVIGGPVTTFGVFEEWEAPDGSTAERWRDEVNARGGAAEIGMLADGTGANRRWFVRIIRAIPLDHVEPNAA